MIEEKTIAGLMKLEYEATNLWFCVAQGESVRNQAEAADAAVESYARTLVAAEREACAQLCDDMVLYTGFDCAAKIRERSNVAGKRPVPGSA